MWTGVCISMQARSRRSGRPECELQFELFPQNPQIFLLELYNSSILASTTIIPLKWFSPKPQISSFSRTQGTYHPFILCDIPENFHFEILCSLSFANLSSGIIYYSLLIPFQLFCWLLFLQMIFKYWCTFGVSIRFWFPPLYILPEKTSHGHDFNCYS